MAAMATVISRMVRNGEGGEGRKAPEAGRVAGVVKVGGWGAIFVVGGCWGCCFGGLDGVICEGWGNKNGIELVYVLDKCEGI